MAVGRMVDSGLAVLRDCDPEQGAACAREVLAEREVCTPCLLAGWVGL